MDEPQADQKDVRGKAETELQADQEDVKDMAETGDDGNTGTEGEDPEFEIRIPREHARLDTLLTQIPKKAQHGLLMQCDLILTCIDVNELYLVLGTNISLVFLFNRKNHSMQRLKSEISGDVITCVKLHHGIDHQLAVGMASGALCIFLIPSVMSGHKKQLQKFDVRSVHRHYISCVEWSTNGMKLFSGDKTGHVVVTEVDFYQGQCKSSELLIEPSTEVVQLNYDHKVLLVSTKLRSFICRLDANCETAHIGQQDRKVQGSFGAVFIPALCKVEDALLYAVRPGCRIWLSDIHGSVLNTHIFKDSIGAGVREIPILRPSKSSFNPTAELQFGRLLMYGKQQLMTYNTTTLFLLDPQMNFVLASQNQLGGIVDVAVHKDEVFVLRRHGDSAVVRFAYEPEVLYNAVLPFDLPLSSSTTPTSTTDLTTTTTLAAKSAPPIKQKEEGKEENKTKTFFKKTFLSPFKKLDNFIHERSHASKESAQENVSDLAPVIRGATDSTLSTINSPQDSPSPDLPPVVRLDSPDLALHTFRDGVTKGSGTPIDIQSPDSAHSALSVFAEEVREKESSTVSSAEGVSGVKVEVSIPDGGQDRMLEDEKQVPASINRFHLTALPADDNGDIVFSHQMHKKKAKKKKTKGKGDKETDTISQSSFNSQLSEEPRADNADSQRQLKSEEGEVEKVLSRAEQVLASVDSLLKGTGDCAEKGQLPGQSLPTDKEDNSPATVEQRLNKTVPGSGTQGDSDSIPGESSQQEPVKDQTVFDSAMSSPHTVASSSASHLHAAMPEDIYTTSSVDGRMKIVGEENVIKLAESSFSESGLPISNQPLQLLDQAGTDAPEGNVASSSPEKDLASLEIAREEVDPLEAAERSLDSMTNRYKLPDTRQESGDDFYSMFASPSSPTDVYESLSFTNSGEHGNLRDFDSSTEVESSRQVSVPGQGSGSERSVPEATLQKLANSWSEFTTPANIYSLALSSTHVWFTDKSEKLYYSALSAVKGIVWRKVGESASQISVSPSGHIVWRLHRGRVFAGTKITQRRPEGLKWVEAVNSVVQMSVDDHCAWYVKTSGDVMMQRGLSKERPCFRSLTVETGHKVKQVMARYGVVWAITDTYNLLVRTGISNECPQGVAWQEIHRQMGPYLFSSVTMDNEGIAWALDVLGQIWFTDCVTPQNPVGSGHWWQVPLSEYVMQDPTMLDMLCSLAKKIDTQKLSHILSRHRGGLVVAGLQGVWLSLDCLNTLYVCRSSLQGYMWSTAQPCQMADSAVWKQVHCGICDLDWGLVWAQLVNGELYALTADSTETMVIDGPAFVSYSVNELAVWGLTSEGELYVRTGMGHHCPRGVDWAPLDLMQLGEVCLVHVSCSTNYVWVVDVDGQVFHRIGAGPPRPGQLNPVWLPIDTYSEIVFTKVVNGPLDWMVWAVDNRRLTYVRVGISDAMPIGKEWVHVPGIQAMDLALSSSGVWALNTNGELLFRYGITKEDVSGNYWKKIPGCFTRISASWKDMLWAVSTTGQLMKCSSRHLYRRHDSADPLLVERTTSATSEDGEWELV